MRSSTIIEDRVQIDGRRHVTERHVTDAGRVIDASYMAEAADNARGRMLARVSEIEARIAQEAADTRERNLVDAANGRLAAYVRDAFDLEVKTRTGMTDAELAALRRSLSA